MNEKKKRLKRIYKKHIVTYDEARTLREELQEYAFIAYKRKQKKAVKSFPARIKPFL